MKVMNLVQAINDAMDIKLQEDKSIVVYGEDVGVEGGVFLVTEGLQVKHGKERVFDSPLAESGIAGTALGMAISGMKPIIEMQFDGFSYPAFNQIISHIARFRNRTRGKYHVPMVIRIPYGGGINALEHHSESPEAYFGHTPGLKVVIPSTPYDAKGLLIAAIEDPDPVIYLEPKRIYRAIKQEVPEEKYQIPIGKAKVISQGEDITVIAYGAMLRAVQKAMVLVKEKGISVQLIDLRSIWPIDRDTIGAAVRQTGRALIVTEAQQSYGPAAELISVINEEAFLSLEAPPKRLTGFDTVIPLPLGEKHYMISPQRIAWEIEKLVNY